MSEYIKREDAYREIMECFKNSEMPEEWEHGMHTAGVIVLQDVPSADVVEVVRCKDCVKRHDGCPMQVWCGTDDNDYCSRGERE